MSRTKILILLLVVVVVALAFGLQRKKSAPPAVPFAKVKRERLVSTLITNGKAEPSQWEAVRADAQGLVQKVLVERGQRVKKGALLVEMQSEEARAAVAAAEARLAQARSEVEVLERGGRSTERAEIESGIRKAQAELTAAQREYESLSRLAEKQAATLQDVTSARLRVEAAQNSIKALELKQSALVSPPDRQAADARVRDAEAALALARQQYRDSQLRAPMSGTVFELPARAGAYLAAGDVAAAIGVLDKLRVRVYVDEPELGRVGEDMPVNITWDARPGKEWKGTVDSMPTQVVSVGSRQVGEVICTIDNPDLELIPGTNVNAEITSKVVENGLTVPKEAVRRERGQTGVYVLEGNRIVWRPVQVGASSITRTQIVSGASEGDSVALASDVALRNGLEVQPQNR